MDKILSHLAFRPTGQQAELIDEISSFMLDGKQNGIFLLKGCAGTGKTSVVSALIDTVAELNQPFVLLAPTGRAAHVLSSYSGRPAHTIHSFIYREKVVGELDGVFSLNFNRLRNALFVVDEASMISDTMSDGGFGSGHLLSDLLSFVYNGEGNRIVFVGDVAQLPPVGDMLSPALDASALESAGLDVHQFFLTEVVRQGGESGILFNATNLRLLMPGYDGTMPPVDVSSFPDVKNVTGEELTDEIASAYSRYGVEDTIIISKSNKRANAFNNGVRNMVLMREEELTAGDMIMVVKNNYYWARNLEKLDFIANGDVAEVRRVRHRQELYGFRFADVALYFPDYDAEFEAKIMLDTLQSPSPSLTAEENRRFFHEVESDYAEIGNKRERYKKMKEDPFFNALQVKFAYAVTCHKAQGGQWSCVFVDKGFVPPEQMNIDFLRWLYTAFTRATEKLYLVNWENSQ